MSLHARPDAPALLTFTADRQGGFERAVAADGRIEAAPGAGKNMEYVWPDRADDDPFA